MPELIHWHEGLFLQPHHLQQLQRNAFNAIFRERRLLMAYPYGVVAARLAVDDLENHRVRFDKLHVVLPSGQHLRFPDDAELPSLDIKALFRSSAEGFMIYLAVPVWLPDRPNTVPPENDATGQRVKMIYKVVEDEVPDENVGRNKQPIQYRRLNAMLLMENDDFSDMEFIPLVRVKREVLEEGAGLPRPDPRYVPPSLIMKASPPLMELLRDLTSQVSAVRDELAGHLGHSALNLAALQGTQFEQISRLKALNRTAGRWPSLLAAGVVAPFDMYLELRELLGELAALFPERGDFHVPDYDHDDCYPCFLELCTKIRTYLHGVVKATFRKVEFVLEDGVFVGDISPDLFVGATAFFLSVETTADATMLTRLVEDADKFKLMPASFGLRAIRGITLKEERHPPLELPAKARLYYYRLDLDKSRRIWEQFIREPQALVHFDAPNPEAYKIILYITVPQETTLKPLLRN